MLKVQKGLSAGIRRGQFTVVYSKPGAGKTTLLAKTAIKANGVYIQIGENGLADLSKEKWLSEVTEYPKVLGLNHNKFLEDLEEFKDILKQLYIEKERQFDTICIDGFGYILKDMLAEKVLKQVFGGNKAKAESYDAMTKFIYRETIPFLKMFELLQNKGYNIVTSFHSTLVSSKDYSIEEYKKYTLDIRHRDDSSPRMAVLAAATSVVFIDIITQPNELENEKRVVYTVPTKGWDAKSRQDVPEVYDLTVDNFVKYHITICDKKQATTEEPINLEMENGNVKEEI